VLPASKAWLSNRGFTIPQIERMNKDKRLGSVDLCFRVDGRQILPRPRSANSRFVGKPSLTGLWKVCPSFRDNLRSQSSLRPLSRQVLVWRSSR
jgi:hypothetical protein